MNEDNEPRVGDESFRLILASVTDYAILTIDANRVVTGWSPGAWSIFGYEAPEILGRPGDILFTPEDREAGVPALECTQARLTGRAEDERWHIRKDGTRFYASGVLNLLGDRVPQGFVKVLRDLTDRKLMEDELRAAHDELEARVAERTAELAGALQALEAEMGRRRDLARRLAAAQEAERQRISRDLHDTAGQILAGLAMALKVAESENDPSLAARQVAEARRLVGTLGRELHTLAVRLRPTALDDLGLEAALGQLVAEWSARSGVRSEFQWGLGMGRLAPDVETALYRVVQEALTNVAKHAGASRVSVAVSRLDGNVAAVVEDDGSGFDPDSAPEGRLGMVGMRERIAQAGGILVVESSPGSGTTVVARVPSHGVFP
jgi:PAS domain S-box-containing protein